MIWVFDSGFWWLQTLKYLCAQFPYEDFLFLADTKNVPYGEKDEETLKHLTKKNIERLLSMWCHHVVIACNTAVASIYSHRFTQDIEKKLIAVTKSGVKETILYDFKHIVVLCTQATHRLWVYPSIYRELWWKHFIETLPASELVPLIESDTIDYEMIGKLIDWYAQHIDLRTDCLVLWCTHYPILLDLFREKFPRLKIIDPWRSSIFTLDKRITEKNMKKIGWTWTTRIFCTWESTLFIRGAQRLLKTTDIPPVTMISF